MADCAAIYHWPPSEMREMEVEELFEWRRLGLERLRAMRGVGGI